MNTEAQPDLRVLAICSALFFCYENAVGNVPAALTHLESGLQILKITQAKSKSLVPLAAPVYPLIEDEIMHLYARLDCQATIYDDARNLLLDHSSISGSSKDLETGESLSFCTISDAQRSLDILLSCLTEFLTANIDHKFTLSENMPPEIAKKKRKIEYMFSAWQDALKALQGSRKLPTTNLGSLRACQTQTRCWTNEEVVEFQLSQIRHRVWRMFLRSSFPHDPAVFTAAPNPAAEEVLSFCGSVVLAVLAPQLQQPCNLAGNGFWKLSSETGILAPLFMLAIKCGDDSVRARATEQLQRLRGYKEGLFDADVMLQFLKAAQSRIEKIQCRERIDSNSICPSEQWEEYIQWPDNENLSPDTDNLTNRPLEEMLEDILDAPGGLFVWLEKIRLTTN
ncbi:Fc.00g058190.m01.CDS01 [Cosmosporella sp. VM-42]